MDIFDITNFDPSPRQLEVSDSDLNVMFSPSPSPRIAPSVVEEDPPPAYCEVEEMITPPDPKPSIDATCFVSDRLFPHPRARHFRSLLLPFPPLFRSALFCSPIIMTDSSDPQASTDLSSDLNDVDDDNPQNVFIPTNPSCTSTPLPSRNDAKCLRCMLPFADILLHNANVFRVMAPKLFTPAPFVVFKPP